MFMSFELPSMQEVDRASDLAEISRRMLWFTQPTRVNDSDIQVLNTGSLHPNRYKDIGQWMVDQFAVTVLKYQFGSVDKQSKTQQKLASSIYTELTPGLDTISEYHELTPKVAAREGINDASRWGELALSTSDLAKRVSVHGGDFLGVFREGIAVPDHKERVIKTIDPKNFTLSEDQSSIVPTFDVKQAITHIKGLDAVKKKGRLKNRCPAHFGEVRLDRKSTIPTEHKLINVFDAYYLVYNSIVQRLIYPTLDPNNLD